jgi:TonB family protein
MDKWEDDIKRYINGEMSTEEQHALEKRALRDPFLADALEGAGLIAAEDFTNDIKDLNAEIGKRANEHETENWQVAASAAGSAAKADSINNPTKTVHANNQRKTRTWIWPLRIAASVALLAIVYYAVTPLLQTKDKKLVQSESIKNDEPAEEKKNFVDSIIEDKNIALSETKQAGKISGKSKSKKDSKSVTLEEDKISSSGAAAPSIAKVKEKESEAVAERKVADLIEEKPEIALETKAERKLESAQAVRSEDMSRKRMATTQKVIQGKVLSAEDNTPLPGVNVIVKGTTTGTVTDIHGNYQFVSNADAPTLIYSFIGLKTEEIKVNNQRELIVKLQSDVAQLSEVVITGYTPSGNDVNHEPVIKLAEPIGGRKAYDQYLKNSLRYPQEALARKIKGKVTIQFTVKTDGTLGEFNVLKGLGYGCDEEVVRLVQEGPKWQPTTEDNVAVESEVKVRMKFALPN